ncbi:MAG: ParB/RepB/Spo0J family partition protein [Novosphingobium sp.]
MRLEFIPLARLSVSKANMRHSRKAPDVSDILPTVRSRGVIQPIIVRPAIGGAVPADGPGLEPCFEIVAGARRFHAAQIIARERSEQQEGSDTVAPDTETEPGSDTAAAAHVIACAILDDGDDADAIEASLIENCARLEPDEVTRWEAFIRLVREGRRPDQIAATFGLPDLAVRRILALGNLLPRIRELYRREQIDAGTVRHLTLASKSQQKAWLALMDDPDAYAPRGYQLKGWLFGGQSIPVRFALFDVEASGLSVIADLFGEDSYFADGDAFWSAQNAAIEARRAAYLEAGWGDAVVVPAGAQFQSWEYEKAAKRKGGRVYIDVRANGEVIVHEGYLTSREAARLRKGAGGDPAGEGPGGEGEVRAQRPEASSTTGTYLDLHRHAAVRAALLDSPMVAMRLMVAHAIAGSSLWTVRTEAQSSRNEAVAESVAKSWGQAVFDVRRRAMMDLLGYGADDVSVSGAGGSYSGGQALATIFARLLALPDCQVFDIAAVVMGETLASGSAVVDAVGTELDVKMARWWEADEAFFDTLRDREVLLAMLGEVAGNDVAAANDKEKTSTMKTIIRDCLEGNAGRAATDGWVPRWMAFPPSHYTARGGVGTVEAHARAVSDVELAWAGNTAGAVENEASVSDGPATSSASADEEGGQLAA